MTLIHFQFSDSYHQPSRGSLAFAPHRRHAANETEILPKPFTVSLQQGQATVDLQPNTESWVWAITENINGDTTTGFYTIPEQHDTIPYTNLIQISPSSLPEAYNATEPVWWATMRQYREVIAETLLKSGEALAQAEQALETGEQSVIETHQNASLANAYMKQSRQYSYDSYDEAQRAQGYADELMSGPRDYVDQSREARDEAQAYRDQAEQHATTAYTHTQTTAQHVTEAQTHANQAATEATSAQQANTNATNQATIATEQADLAEQNAQSVLPGDWVFPELNQGFTTLPNPWATPRYRKTPLGIQIVFNVTRSTETPDNATIFTLDPQHRPTHAADHPISVQPFTERNILRIEKDGTVKMRYSQNETTTLHASIIVP